MIVSNARDESDTIPQRCKIVRDNRRRTSQSDRHLVRQQFPFRRQLLWQTIEDQIQIELAGDGYVEIRHFCLPLEGCRPLSERTAGIQVTAPCRRWWVLLFTRISAPSRWR